LYCMIESECVFGVVQSDDQFNSINLKF